LNKNSLVLSTPLTVLVLILVGFGPRSSASPLTLRPVPDRPIFANHPAAQTVIVHFGGALGFNYNPKSIFLSPGDTITWQGDFTMHPLVSDEALWSTPNTGSSFAFTFNQPGVYHFHCFFHGAIGMRGTVFVGDHSFVPLAEK